MLYGYDYIQNVRPLLFSCISLEYVVLRFDDNASLIPDKGKDFGVVSVPNRLYHAVSEPEVRDTIKELCLKYNEVNRLLNVLLRAAKLPVPKEDNLDILAL